MYTLEDTLIKFKLKSDGEFVWVMINLSFFYNFPEWYRAGRRTMKQERQDSKLANGHSPNPNNHEDKHCSNVKNVNVKELKKKSLALRCQSWTSNHNSLQTASKQPPNSKSSVILSEVFHVLLEQQKTTETEVAK